jgi:non-heme chloroperoxidase
MRTEITLGLLTVGRENSTSIDLFYEDHGAGATVMLVPGFPLTGRFWEKQTDALLHEGHRTITYDRRGFGASRRPAHGYDVDTLAADLNALMTALDVREAVLVGMSTGSGDVVRYLSSYGSKRIVRAVLLSPIVPCLLKGNDNPSGLEGATFERMLSAAAADRPAFISWFIDQSFRVSGRPHPELSNAALQYARATGVDSTSTGLPEYIASWLTDFRPDLTRVDVPVLAIAGGADAIVPSEAAAKLLPSLLRDCTFLEIEGAPHNCFWTHADSVNRAMLDFIDN